MSNTDKILDKIRKLLALSERNNSPEEAAAAAALAADMLFEHKLSMADVETPDEYEDSLGSIDFQCAGAVWKTSLVHGVSRAFYCRGCTVAKRDPETNGQKIVRIVGKLSDVQSASYMAAYLINEIDQLAKQHAGNGRRWTNSFKVGAVSTVLNRLDEQKKAQEVKVAAAPAGTALVLRNDAVAVQHYFRQLFPRTVSGSRMRATSGDGFSAGKEAGAGISLGGGKGLGAQAKQLR